MTATKPVAAPSIYVSGFCEQGRHGRCRGHFPGAACICACHDNQLQPEPERERRLRIGSLFSGYEGLGMAVQSVLGGDIAWVSDIDPGACKILAHRYPDVPNIGDITAVDWSAVEPVDVLTGGFPCTDVSCAGLRLGLTPDTRSGLWTRMAYAIDKLRPPLVVIENVRGLLSARADHPAHSDLEPCPWCLGDDGLVPLRALGAVLGDLADIGYDASWQGLRAADVGAPHGRFRVFIVAWPAADAHHAGRGEHSRTVAVRAEQSPVERRRGAAADPLSGELQRRRVGGVVDGSAGPAGGSRDQREWDGHAASNGCAVAPDSDGGRRESLRITEPPGVSSARRGELDGRAATWGQYDAAIRRWERLTRPAPSPTERGKNGQPRLSPAFVEWMQGLPAGWVTDVPGLTRNEQLKALGNGVVPQQAAHALRLLLPDVARAAA